MNALLLPFVAVLLWLYDFLASLVLVFVPHRYKRRKDVTGQNILITGAGAGLGRQIAIEFSKLSTCLILLDIDKPSLQETEKLLDGRSKTFLYECDVSKPDLVYKVADKIKKEVGDVDILVNNAGIVSGKALLELPDENIVKTMAVNVLAHFWMCKAFLPAMIAQNRGHVVSIVSIMGKTGGPSLTDYAASKFAAFGFAESLEMELREQMKDGIKVTIVCPSLTDTGLFEGVKINVLSTLTAQYVAKEIVQGILEGKELICIPYWSRALFCLKEIAPRWLVIWLHDQTGDIHGMLNFKGRSSTSISGNPKLEKLK